MSAALERADQPPSLIGLSEPQIIQLLQDQIAPGASPAELAYYVEWCRRFALSPLGEQAGLVGRYDKRLRRKVFRPEVFIAGRRALAQRTGLLARVVGPRWCGPDRLPNGHYDWLEVWLSPEPPHAAQVLVYKVGEPEPYANGTLPWREFAQKGEDGSLMTMWARYPSHMLGIRAESLALRRAFPEAIDPAIITAGWDPDGPGGDVGPDPAEVTTGGGHASEPASDELRNELAGRLAELQRRRPAATDELRRRWIDLFSPEPAPVVRAGPYTVDQALHLDDWLREVEDRSFGDDPNPPPDLYDNDPEAFDGGPTRYDPDDAA